VAVVSVGQTPGAPSLTLTLTETNSVVVCWPLPADGWVLQWTNQLSEDPDPWPQVSPPYQTNATRAWFVEPALAESKFYRLQKP
jgi:hypothetical protein